MPDLRLVTATLPDAIDRIAARAIEHISAEIERMKEDVALVDEVHRQAAAGNVSLDSADAAAVIDFQLWTPCNQIQLSTGSAGGYVQLQEPMADGRWRAVILLYRTGDR